MRKIIIILALVTIASLESYTQTRSYYELIPYRKGKLWGYCDTLKKRTIAPVYDQVEWFSLFNKKGDFPEKKLAIVKRGKKFGLIGPDGHTIIPLQYDTIRRSYVERAYILSKGNVSYAYFVDSGKIKKWRDENGEASLEPLRPVLIDCKANEAAITFKKNGGQILVLLMKEVYAPDGRQTRVPRDTIRIEASDARNIECSGNSFYFKTQNGWGAMTSGGALEAGIIVPAVYDSLYSPMSDEFIGRQNGKWAAILPIYKKSTMPVYDSIEHKGPFFIVKRNDLWGILLRYSNKEVLIDRTRYKSYGITTLPGNEYLVTLHDGNGKIEGYVNFNNGLKYWD